MAILRAATETTPRDPEGAKRKRDSAQPYEMEKAPSDPAALIESRRAAAAHLGLTFS